MIEEDLEEELRKLEINEDLGEEESDVTPTNNPSSFSSIFGSFSSHCSQNDYLKFDFANDDLDLRTNSSLSWGEDEFEGEATRIVNCYFNQIDDVMYQDSSKVDVQFPLVHVWKSKKRLRKLRKSHSKINNPDQKIRNPDSKINNPDSKSINLDSKSRNPDSKSRNPDSKIINPDSEIRNPDSRIKDLDSQISKATTKPDSKSTHPDSQIRNSDFQLSYSLENYTSVPDTSKDVNIASPSSELVSECKEWMNNFPHLRVCGVGINISRYEEIFSQLLNCLGESDAQEETSGNSEETILIHGNPQETVAVETSMKSDNKSKKTKGVSSRVCSGSEDPVVLKEHILIKLFEQMWVTTSQMLEPLLERYSQALEEPLQLTSFSRESSCYSDRPFPALQNLDDLQEHQVSKFDSFHTRKLLNRRPSSAAYRLEERPTLGRGRSAQGGRTPIETICQHFDFKKKDSVPPRILEERINLPNLPGLPYLSSIATRPLSSKAGRRFLTPIPTSDRRPVSTSTYTRSRLNGSPAILQSPTPLTERPNTMDDEIDQRNSSSSYSSSRKWSRHRESFLPKIIDSNNKVLNNVWRIAERPDS